MSRRPTTTRRLLLDAALVLTAGTALAVVGLDLPHALVLTAGTLVLLVLYRRTRPGDDPEHHALPDRNRHGARRDLSELTWAMHGNDGRVSERAHRRVLALAATALADRGIDLRSTDPAQQRAAADLLGPKVHQQMTTGGRPPTMPVLRAWVTAVEDVSGISAGPGRAPAAQRRTAGDRATGGSDHSTRTTSITTTERRTR
ncbi:hypothetical protein ACWFNS_03250 [Oerskovia enterophila]